MNLIKHITKTASKEIEIRIRKYWTEHAWWQIIRDVLKWGWRGVRLVRWLQGDCSDL